MKISLKFEPSLQTRRDSQYIILILSIKTITCHAKKGRRRVKGKVVIITGLCPFRIPSTSILVSDISTQAQTHLWASVELAPTSSPRMVLLPSSFVISAMNTLRSTSGSFNLSTPKSMSTPDSWMQQTRRP